MLAEIFMDIVGDTLVGFITTCRSKRVILVFGYIAFVVSLVILFYLRSIPPTTLESYHTKEIRYSQVSYDSQKGNNRKSTDSGIVIVADDKTYDISYQVWRNHFSHETIVGGLAKSNRAMIWLNTPDSHEIKGIVAPTFSIKPELGVEWDNYNIDWGVVIAWGGIASGGFLVLIAMVISSKL